MGMSPGSIPWKVVHDYCVAYNLSQDQTESMHEHLAEMDSVYLEHLRKKNK